MNTFPGCISSADHNVQENLSIDLEPDCKEHREHLEHHQWNDNDLCVDPIRHLENYFLLHSIHRFYLLIRIFLLEKVGKEKFSFREDNFYSESFLLLIPRDSEFQIQKIQNDSDTWDTDWIQVLLFVSLEKFCTGNIHLEQNPTDLYSQDTSYISLSSKSFRRSHKRVSDDPLSEARDLFSLTRCHDDNLYIYLFGIVLLVLLPDKFYKIESLLFFSECTSSSPVKAKK